MLLYEDEAVFRQSGSIFRHWAKRGIGSEVKTFPNRKSVKVMGAVKMDTDPKFHFRFVKTFNSRTYLAFLKHLSSRYQGQKMHLIADNAKYHSSPDVMEWVTQNQEKIELHFLPKYSPELNAQERIWKETRKRTTHNRFFSALQTLKDDLFRRFNRFQGNPASLRSLVASFA